MGMAAAERQQRHSWRPRLQQLGVVDAGAVGRDRCRKEMRLGSGAAAVGEEQGDEGAAAVAEGETRHLGGRILTTPPVSTAGIVIVALLSLQLAPVAQMRRQRGGRLVQVAGVEDGRVIRHRRRLTCPQEIRLT